MPKTSVVIARRASGTSARRPFWGVCAVVLVAAVVGFALQPNGPLGSLVWPPVEGGTEPVGVQLPLLMAVGVWEALAFGAGVAFLVFGWPLVARSTVAPALARATHLAIAWGLVSWVPHTSMHISNHATDLGRLIVIEYVFHVTLVAAAAITAWFFVETLRARSAPVTASATARPLVAPVR